MGRKNEDWYVLGVQLAKWEYGSCSTESKPKTQAAFKDQWGKILAKQIKESWRNASVCPSYIQCFVIQTFLPKIVGKLGDLSLEIF